MTDSISTQTPTAAEPRPTRVSGLRSLHVIRAAFSVVWVALLFATSATLTSLDKPSAIAAVLLVVYPLWDVAATLLERRMAGPGSTNLVSIVNVSVSLAAAIAMIVAATTTIGSALLVFGVWALLSGAIQLFVAIRRRHTVGAQWPMLISGGLSVLAGAAFAAMSGAASSTLVSVGGYALFGAFWFLVSAIALTVKHRRALR